MARRHPFLRPAVHLAALAAMVLPTVAAAPTAPVDDAMGPVDTAANAVAACDDLDARLCLLPFPNDQFTVMDAATGTGRHVALDPLAMPRNVAGKPVDPTEWNRNDGFSPGAEILTYVPGLDLTTTYDLDTTPETGPAVQDGDPYDPYAVRDSVPDALIEDPVRSLSQDSPIVLLDADTGQRHPFFAELDEHPQTLADGEDRVLIVRPLVNLAEGHRYIVALRDLKNAAGDALTTGDAFTSLRDRLADAPAPGAEKWCDGEHPGKGKGPGQDNGNGHGPKFHCRDGESDFPAPADIDPADRDARYADIFDRLAAVGVDPTDLYLAWDFHVASEQNLAGRALAIRDDAFAQLGDTDLGDGEVPKDSHSPSFSVDSYEDGMSNGMPTRTVHGTVTVPNYLTWPQDGLGGDGLAAAGAAAQDGWRQVPAEIRDPAGPLNDVIGLADDAPPIVPPDSRFLYASPLPGPMDTPIQNPAVPTLDAEFTCKFRTDVGPTKPTLYGHGLLGGRGEVEGGSTEDLRRGGHAMCGVDWIGMATEDITNVGLILNDVSFFPSLADRAQQGFLDFLYVGRALIADDGLVHDPAFQDADENPLLDTSELFYDGNSQGGIMGGALTALAPDFTKAVLGVPGMNYSTLLNRSVDWEGEFFDPANPDIPAYSSFMYDAYPDKVEQQLVFSLIQMMWDRAEANGYALHMTTDPLPNTPPHQVLLEAAFGDYQVTNHSVEVEARTIGADFLGTALATGRHWDRRYATGEADAPFGLRDFVDPEDGPAYAPSGSALVYWDSGNPTPFNGNVHPADLDADPHEDPRRDDFALAMKLRFYTDGVIADVHDGHPNWNQRCRDAYYHPGPC